MSFSYVKENLDDIKENIKQACEKTGRNAEDVTLVAVTKTVESEVMNASIDYGVKIVGENRVQEIRRKFEDVKPVSWHQIGHLQTNKVKYIADKVDMIHSVDSLKLAKEISKRANQHDRTIDILLQVNIAGEEQKFGIDESELPELIHEVSQLPSVQVKGLMLIAPFAENPETVRPIFRRMKEIFDLTKNRIYNGDYTNIEMQYLSMGMSGDYVVAIEEGANMVRIGSGIFGVRTY
ncbi:YggS family pyridoxal phosphate-dependent enzyme [Fusibacter sp. JL216-2]|uniref:YggS family pyridoxal phosphate-dependent enzyme n=1 Tax=Fusibacter sp. JL216-2 TaxID=3071453 RepID=UPI003D3532EF